MAVADFYTALRDGIRDSACSFLQDASNWKRTFDRLGPFDTPNSVLPNAPSLAYGLFCNRAPQAPTPPGPDFNNGQCPGTVYNLNVTVQATQRIGGGAIINVTDSNNGNFVGPIIPLGIEYPQSGNPANPVTWRYNFTAGTPPVTGFIQTGQSFVGINSYSVTVTPVSGPDNCGGPPAEDIPPPLPNSNIFNPTITFQNDNNVTVTVSPVVAIGVAFLDARAEINIPVDINLGDIVLQANLNLSTGDINFGPSFNINSPGTSGRPAKPCECIPPTGSDEEPPTRPPGVPQPPAPPEDPVQGERRIVGAIVTVTNDAGADSIDNSLYGCPDVATPYYGLCFFVHKSDSGLLSWSEDYRIKTRQQYISCPWPDGAVSVAVAPRYPQQTVVATPIYREDSQLRETEPIV